MGMLKAEVLDQSLRSEWLSSELDQLLIHHNETQVPGGVSQIGLLEVNGDEAHEPVQDLNSPILNGG